MNVRSACDDVRGTAAVELALTSPAFLALVFGAIEYGIVMWTQIGLQHGVEMAARCAVITPSICSSASATQSYAASQAYGLSPPASTFSVSTPTCGEQINANYKFTFLTSYLGRTITLTAMSCFPK